MGKSYADRTTLLVTFGYDGARFFGLQPQADRPSAGAALALRLQEAAGDRARGLAFSARTDRGVHAVENRATCYFRGLQRPVDELLAALAEPRDDGLIGVTAVVVPPTVHARGEARGKHYRYRVRPGCDPTALQDGHAWRIVPTIDLARLQEGARHLEGTHDFSSLRGQGCSAANTVKTLAMVAAHGDADCVVLDVIGDAFLRKMVRNLVGLLVEVGTGWRPADDVPAVLAARTRQAAGLCAPPEGLTLVKVGFGWPQDGSNAIVGVEPPLPL